MFPNSAASFLYATQLSDVGKNECLIEEWDIVEHPTFPPPPSQTEDVEHWTRAMFIDATKKWSGPITFFYFFVSCHSNSYLLLTNGAQLSWMSPFSNTNLDTYRKVNLNPPQLHSAELLAKRISISFVHKFYLQWVHSQTHILEYLKLAICVNLMPLCLEIIE